jgi:hypothetical protein
LVSLYLSIDIHSLVSTTFLALPIFATSLLSSLSSRNPAQLSGFQKNGVAEKNAALTFNNGPYIYEKDIVKTLDSTDEKNTFINFNNFFHPPPSKYSFLQLKISPGLYL